MRKINASRAGILTIGIISLFAATAYGQLITDFEGYANGTQVMFEPPNFSGTTSGNLNASPNFSGVTSSFPTGNANSGLSAYYTTFSFLASNPSPLWVRYVTAGTANLPNPTIDITKGLSFDIYTDRPLYVALSIRETSSTAAIGGDGGTSGTLEYVGGTTDNTTSPPEGRLVPANTWVTLQFNLPSEPVRAFTGDGVLTSTTGKDTLDGLVLLANSGQTGTYNVWFDNFQVVPIPEPSSMALALGIGVGALVFLRGNKRNKISASRRAVASIF